MPIDNAGVVAADERTLVAQLLSRYPDNLEQGDLAYLHNWFDRIATPLDLGLLAGDPAITAQYQAYRATHIDRFKPKDIGKAVLFAGAVAAVAGAIFLMAP